MKYLLNHMYGSMLLACMVALGLFLALTNPANVNIGLLVVPVVLLFFIAFCVSHMVMTGLKLLPAEPRKKRTVAVVSASFSTIIVILQSTGGISGADLLLLGLIIIVAGLYISKF